MPAELHSPSQLTQNRFPDLNLPPDLIQPWYQGGSLLNLPAAIGSRLGATAFPHPPLHSNIMENIPEVNQVILCLLDGLSFNRFSSWIENHEISHRISQDGFLKPLTSIAPSTTCAVLTTLWTGRSPSEHAVLGYELFLKEYGIVSNMITHSPIKIPGEHGLLYRAGFEPDTASMHHTLGTIFRNRGISTHAFLNKHIRRSGLSRMHFADTAVSGFASLADMWITVRSLAERKDGKKRFLWCYYEGVDNLSHHRHPDNEYPRAEFETFLYTMNEFFLKPADLLPGKTLLLMTADHGHIATPDNPDFDLSNHPDLVKMLHLFPTGENRLTYLHVRPGMVDEVHSYFHKTWGDTFYILKSKTALDEGLFGPGEAAPQAIDRTGDLTVVSTGDSYLWWGERPNPLEGRHGGLSADEMIVPLAGIIL